MISLSFKNIIDELFALTAMRRRMTPGSENLPQTLDRDDLPALRILVRNAFSETAARLLPYLSDAATDSVNTPASLPYDSTSPLELNLDFGSYTARLSSGAMLVLRRQLEHLVTITILSKLNAGVNRTEISELLESIVGFLSLSAPDFSPLQIRPYA